MKVQCNVGGRRTVTMCSSICDYQHSEGLVQCYIIVHRTYCELPYYKQSLPPLFLVGWLMLYFNGLSPRYLYIPTSPSNNTFVIHSVFLLYTLRATSYLVLSAVDREIFVNTRAGENAMVQKKNIVYLLIGKVQLTWDKRSYPLGLGFLAVTAELMK